MASFENFAGGDAATINKIYKQARLGLEKCVFEKNTDMWRRHFGSVFGTASGDALKKAEESVKKSVANMFARIATSTFTVKYDATLAANAEMVSFAGVSPDEITNTVDSWRASNQNTATMTTEGKMIMRVGPAMMAMANIALDAQCQVETFLHELSHHAAGTIDDKVGGECYDLVGVNRLKALGPERAVRNAENIGFFCIKWCH